MSGSVKRTFGLSIFPLLLGIVLLINNCSSGDDSSGKSYSDSAEMYVVAVGFRGGAKNEQKDDK